MIDKIQEVQSTAKIGGIKNKRWAMFDQESSAASQDGLAVSSFAREMANISAEMARIPEVREDKVADIKRRIDEGTYKIDCDALAARLVWAGINRVEG